MTPEVTIQCLVSDNNPQYTNGEGGTMSTKQLSHSANKLAIAYRRDGNNTNNYQRPLQYTLGVGDGLHCSGKKAIRLENSQPW